MKCKRFLVVAAFLAANCSLIGAQTEGPQPPNKVLRNGDILRLHNAGLEPAEIIRKIESSSCRFDTFPPVLRELRMKGLPEPVIKAMVMVPYGPPVASSLVLPPTRPAPRTIHVQIPAGTAIEVATTSSVSSAHAVEGDHIKFLVARRVLVDGVLVIERGALARARVVKSKRAGTWGRGGSLDWVLEDVVAVDGTRVPITLADRLAGKNVSKALVAAAIATGAVIFPYTPPAGLIWALKKGDEAVLDESRKSTAVVSRNTEVAGLLPVAQKVIYHPVEKLKAAQAETGAGLPAFNNSFRATPIRKH